MALDTLVVSHQQTNDVISMKERRSRRREGFLLSVLEKSSAQSHI